ncbi:MAG TPA: DUF4350 domain-containing protein [Blastocatellia bacterium]|nr:DUF4350 domain-containing protein [Blastocatellia bacterium]
MRRYLGLIITGLLVLAVLLALSAAGSVEFDRPEESEQRPIRSSYSSGPTGTRAFYQLLEETNRPIARWRESYQSLGEKADKALLVVVGPFQFGRELPPEETLALQAWIAAGGNALIISRTPVVQLGDSVIHSEITAKPPLWQAPPESLVDDRSDLLIVQPTDLTRGLKGLALSTLAARMKFDPPDSQESEASEEAPDQNDETEKEVAPAPEASPSPSPSPSPPPPPSEPVAEEEKELLALAAPVIHLGDKDGAVLADFAFGEGRVVFLSDPFVIANNGVARGANLELALNLIDSLSVGEDETPRRILFDEFHHGYQSGGNPLISYFRGTPMLWLLVQGLLLGLLILYSSARRFVRPLPLARPDRHSPLEFVSSMANLQRVARARDLAIENIYSRFKTQLCRRLGLSSRATVEEIVSSLRRRQVPVSEMEVRQALSAGELVLNGEPIDDPHLIKIVARMRRILAQLGK